MQFERVGITDGGWDDFPLVRMLPNGSSVPLVPESACGHRDERHDSCLSGVSNALPANRCRSVRRIADVWYSEY